MDDTRTVRVIGAPTDDGANRRGVDTEPSAIRFAGPAAQPERAGAEAVDDGGVPAPRTEERDPSTRTFSPGRSEFLHTVGCNYFKIFATPVVADSSQTYSRQYQETREVTVRPADRVESAPGAGAGAFPVVVGGDHSIAIGSVVGAARDADVGAVWFDAHPDCNTSETSSSGNLRETLLTAELAASALGRRIP